MRRSAVLCGLILFALCAVLVIRANRTPAPRPASASATEFSAERAMRHVRAMAQRPHPTGSQDNARVRAYLVAELTALGLTPQIQEATGVGTRYPVAGRVYNVLARVPGTSPGGPAVLLMAHYDGVEAAPAAGDDASGSSMLLETLRALRAGPPLVHDVIALFTDGEEPGLLGAAAFVREHRWARDVGSGVTLNFDNRGTGGRVFMFETGAGNLDAVRVLRGAPGVSATSLMVTVYRTLPNDTDLSEVAVLKGPALNFAFADGVERYHTTQDDVEHLDPGSLQSGGAQMVALARAFGVGPLPRPRTGDAVFFDFPVLGLVLYPEAWAIVLAVIAAGSVLALIPLLRRREKRWARDLALGVAGTLAAVLLGGGAALAAGRLIGRFHQSLPNGGAPGWRGIYAAAIALLAVALAAACWALVRRWASVAGSHVGALLVWTALTVVVTVKVPGASFLFVWPLLSASAAALVALRATAGRSAVAAGALGTATVVATALLVPMMYLLAVVLIGAIPVGGIAIGVLVPLLVWLLAPLLELLAGGRRWSLVFATSLAALILFVVAGWTVRQSAEHPVPSLLVYALDADGTGAWLTTPSQLARPGRWGEKALGPSARIVSPTEQENPNAAPGWITRLLGRETESAAAPAPRAAMAGPVATVIADSAMEAGRRVLLRIRPAPGTLVLLMRARNTPVLAASIDGRLVDTSRYRSPSRGWALAYSAPPDSGILLALTVPRGATPELELAAQSPGIPSLPGLEIPARPASVLAVQTGDITVVYRRFKL